MNTPTSSLTIAGQIDVLLRSATNFAAQLAIENEKLKTDAARWVAFRDATIRGDEKFLVTFIEHAEDAGHPEKNISPDVMDAAVKVTS